MNILNDEYSLKQEMQRQEKAEQLERAHSKERNNASIDQYRFLDRALRRDNIPALPQGFTGRVMQFIQDFEENAVFEKWVQRIVISAAIIGAIMFALPQWTVAVEKISSSIELPWPMLLATSFALAFAAAIDYFSRRYLFTSQQHR